ncbi:MAG: hypothetical protein LUD27_03120 [Clostridia bacterium]|nr:hypothetical protein [Clostridia bacterium]
MSIVRCGDCGARVSSTAYSCPVCGRDVRSLQEYGHCCGDCSQKGDSDMGWCEKPHPRGCPCLGWRRIIRDTDD